MNYLKQLATLLFMLPLLSYSSASFGQETETPSKKKYKFYTGLGVLGNYSNTSSGIDESINYQIAIAPFFGVAIGSFVIGTSLEFAYEYQDSKTYSGYSFPFNSYSESKTYAVNPKVRYYSPVGLFLDAGYYLGKIDSYGATIISSRYGTSNIYSTKAAVIGPNASIGYAITAGTHFLIEPLVNCAYLGINPDSKRAKEYNTLILNAGIGFSLRF